MTPSPSVSISSNVIGTESAARGIGGGTVAREGLGCEGNGISIDVSLGLWSFKKVSLDNVRLLFIPRLLHKCCFQIGHSFCHGTHLNEPIAFMSHDSVVDGTHLW